MREIKFRLWDKEEKRVIYLDRGYPYHHTFSVKEGGNIEYYNLQNGSGGSEYDIMQYTGLKDKNGVEIYEGDIIQYTSEIMRKKVWNCEIERIGATFAVRTGEKSYMDGSYLNVLARDKQCEIIGNIYENPELLEVE